MKAEIEGINITFNIKYSIDYNAKIEAQDVSNSISIDDLSYEDEEEIMNNIQKNQFLSSILQSFVPTTPVYDY